MARRPFKGSINVDIRDSEPDWSPFEPPKAPDGAPNVVYIVLDDVGFSAMNCYGGPIETPNIDRIADEGVRYTQFHTTALCSPTRSCLLTGRNHTRNSMACITEAAIGFPNASGTIPPENGMLSEILGERGWNTYMVGKWHLCPTDEMNLAATQAQLADAARGFERWYGFLGAETNQWYPDLVYDNHMVDQPRTPEEGYHLTDDITDKALEFIRDAKAIAPDKPFFLYYAPGACHAPHHAPKEWIDKFKGRFDMGYEAMREQTLANQRELGIVPKDTELPELNPIGTPDTRGPGRPAFPELDTVGRGTVERRREAALRADGRGLRRLPCPCRPSHRPAARLLEATGALDNTMIVLVSDNGASGEGGPNGSVNEMKFANGVPDDLAQNLAMLDELGGPMTYNHYPTGWAMAFNTPFKMWKRYEFNGGTTTPASSRGRPAEARARFASSTTTRSIWSRRSSTCSASSRRRRSRGTPEPLRRRDHARELRRRLCRVGPEDPVLLDARLPVDLARGLEGGDDHPAIADGATSTRTTWELYHVDVDRSELNNLAEEQPDKLRELINLWFAEAGANVALPLDDRSPVEIFATPRPQLASPRDRYVYFPDTAPVPEWQAVNIRDRSFVDRRARRYPGPGAQGVLFAHRGALRRARALRQGQPAALREQLRRCEEQLVVGTRTSRPART